MQVPSFSNAAIAAAILLACVTESVPFKRHKRSTDVAQFFMTPNSHGNYSWTVPNAALQQQQHNSQQALLDYLTTCPEKVITAPNAPVNVRSPCPWYYEADHNPTRFPTTILKAKTSCRTCIGSDILVCSAVMQTVSILRQEEEKDSAGNFIHTESSITIPVGFTCAAPPVAPNAAATSTPIPSFFAK